MPKLKTSRGIRKVKDAVRSQSLGLKVRREFLEEVQALVIFLRFGSLNSDSQTWMRPTDVFKRTGVRMCSQLKIIRRWKSRGFVIVREKHLGRKETLSQDQVRHITSLATLEKVSHLSLRKRALLHKEELGLSSFSAFALREYYLKNDIKFKRPDYRYWKSLAQNRNLQEDQLEFVQELGSIIMSKAYDEIIYVDETSFSLQHQASRCWLASGMKLKMVNTKGRNICVIGGISQERGLIHYHLIAESNNAEHFGRFIQDTKRKCEGRRVIIVLDNHRIHYAKKLNCLYDADFKLMFLPTYSSELNPIERLWSLLKRKWVQDLQLYVEELQDVRKTRNEEEVIKRT